MPNHILQNDNHLLIGLFKKIEELKHFNLLFAKYVDAELVKHCQVVKFEKNCLFVLAENGSWTTQLRFQIPELMSKLRHHSPLENLSGIICKTRPSAVLKKTQKVRRPAVQLSVDTAASVLETAQTINDQKIRSILEKIATRIRKAY